MVTNPMRKSGDVLRRLTGRPDIVTVEGVGARAIVAAAYRRAFRRARFVLHLPSAPVRPGPLHRFVAASADSVVIGPAGEPWLAPAEPAGTSHEAPAGLAAQGIVLRFVCLGDLAPRTAAADFLDCAIAWAERHPARRLDIAWIGEGDLRGVFAAQPLPDNLSQSFRSHLPTADLANLLAASDVLLLPEPGLPERAPAPPPSLAAALPAGLPVIGSRHGAAVRSALAGGQPGWLFDAARPASIMAVLARALEWAAAAPSELRERRRAASEPAHGRHDAARAVVIGDADAVEPLPGGAASALA